MKTIYRNFLFLCMLLCFGSCSDNSLSEETFEEPQTRILASKNDIADFIGKKNFKLVFRNESTGNLVCLDYTTDENKLIEISTGIDGYHPDISPNGRWVAFSTTYEGTSGESKVYVLDLNRDSSEVIELDSTKAAIPRWNIFDKGDTELVYVSNTGLSQVKYWKSYSTSKVSFKNGKFGKKEVIFDKGAFHGGISKDGRFAVTSAARLIARRTSLSGEYKDEIWYKDDQTCNASLFMDGTNRTLFLDMAGTRGVKFVGKKYRPHQNILVVDSTGKLISAVPSPKEEINGSLVETAFDHTEWITGEIAIAVIANVSDLRHRKIALVNLKDSTMLDLVESDFELWHPDLWVGENR